MYHRACDDIDLTGWVHIIFSLFSPAKCKAFAEYNSDYDSQEGKILRAKQKEYDGDEREE